MRAYVALWYTMLKLTTRPAYGAPVYITTLAGNGQEGIATGDGGPATAAGLPSPCGVWVDSTGNVYVADSYANSIRLVTTGSHNLTTLAGGYGGPYGNSTGYGGDGGPATSAVLSYICGVAADSAGNVYISDSSNHRIRKVAGSTRVITTVAGTGVQGYSGDNGPGSSAMLSAPANICTDAAGNVYIADKGNNRVRLLTVNGTITTLAGSGIQGFDGDGLAATLAQLHAPYGVAVDKNSGTVYITDLGNNRVRAVSPITLVISTVAGTGTLGLSGDGGMATSAQLAVVCGLAVDSSGNVFMAETAAMKVRKLTIATGIISTAVGTGTPGFAGDGGPATAAELFEPSSVAFDSADNLYIADTNNFRVRVVSTTIPSDSPSISPSSAAAPTGSGTSTSSPTATAALGTSSSPLPLLIFTMAGTGSVGQGTGSSPDGTLAIAAALNTVGGVGLDAAGNVFVADAGNNRVLLINASTGLIHSVAGTGVGGYSGDLGPATLAQLNAPDAVVVDRNHNVFIADSSNNCVRRVAAQTAIISTIAGTGSSGYSDGGPATAAQFTNTGGLALDAAGNLYICDMGNCRVRLWTASTGVVTTVAGSGAGTGALFGGDGGAATNAILNNPTGVAVDASGNVIIADSGNSRVRKLAAGSGVISTIVGTGVSGVTVSGGAGTSVQLGIPTGVAVDASGNVLIADQLGNCIVTWTSSTATVHTLAGNGTFGSSGDGGSATAAELASPVGVAVDSVGRVYIADMLNSRVRMVAPFPGTPAPPSPTVTHTAPLPASGSSLPTPTAANSGSPTPLSSPTVVVALSPASTSTSTITALAAAATGSSLVATPVAPGTSSPVSSAVLTPPSSPMELSSQNTTLGDAASPDLAPSTVAGAVVGTLVGASLLVCGAAVLMRQARRGRGNRRALASRGHAGSQSTDSRHTQDTGFRGDRLEVLDAPVVVSSPLGMPRQLSKRDSASPSLFRVREFMPVPYGATVTEVRD